MTLLNLAATGRASKFCQMTADKDNAFTAKGCFFTPMTGPARVSILQLVIQRGIFL